MAVVIGDSGRGALVYRSVRGIEVTDAEKRQAEELDGTIQKRLKKLEEQIVADGINDLREKAELYWRLGQALQDLLVHSNLVGAETPYFFQNVEYRAPKVFEAQKTSRGANRQHLVYCFRLGKYRKEIALKLKWSEWSYLFDRSGINQELRFDKWFSSAIDKHPGLFDRKTVRLLGKVLHIFFSKTETADLSDVELYRCYDAALLFCKRIQNKAPADEEDDVIQRLLTRRNLIAQVMDARISPETFCQSVMEG